MFLDWLLHVYHQDPDFALSQHKQQSFSTISLKLFFGAILYEYIGSVTHLGSQYTGREQLHYRMGSLVMFLRGMKDTPPTVS